MKLLHEFEDSFIGIVIGLIIIGLSGYFYSIPDWGKIFGIIFGISAVFTLLDFLHTLSDLGNKIIPLFFLFINNFIDIVIEVAFTAFYFDYNIPFLSDFMNPFLTDSFALLVIGIFFVVSSVFWIIATPIIWKNS